MKNRIIVVINFNKNTILVSIDDQLKVLEMEDKNIHDYWGDYWGRFSDFGKEYDLHITWTNDEPIVVLHEVLHNQRQAVGLVIEKVVVLRKVKK